MSTKVICIIDDDAIYQLLIRKIIAISNTGYESICFSNGQEALDYFAADLNKRLPEIILLDLEMPVMDGWLFLKEIEKQEINNTAIYVVSSSISHEDKEKINSFTKIKGHFSKPFTPTNIIQITQQAGD